jgi:cobalt-zinc-cadmium efflux system membrane fusion protein
MRKLHFAILALSAILGLGGCEREAKPSVSQPPAGEAWLAPAQITDAKIATAPVAEREIGTQIVTSGRVAFDDLHVSHVFSPVTGRITKIEAQLGQKVKKGAALAWIDSPDLGAASADFDKAHADLVAAEHELARQKELFEAHAGTKRDLETAQDNYAKAKAELERARSKARLLRGGMGDVSQNYVLRSLIDGEIISRTVNPGMEVTGQYSGGGAVELFTVGDLDPVWVLADVFEMDLARVKVGSTVQAKVVSYPEKVFDGTIDFVPGTLDPTTRTAKVRCTIHNAEQLLKPEMYATVTISSPGAKALAVPRTSLLRLGDQVVVFVSSGQTPEGHLRFVRRPVDVDEDEPGEWVPVLHGLEAGESVVTSGAILLAGMVG